MITATPEQLAAAFTEWERQYREDPEKFFTAQEQAAMSPQDYGQSAAPYFMKVLAKIKGE